MQMSNIQGQLNPTQKSSFKKLEVEF